MDLNAHLKKTKDEIDKNGRNKDFTKTDNWFKFTKAEHTLRLVGDFIVTNSHWIGPSTFNPLKLFPDSCFKDEGKLPYQINCHDWDIDTESRASNGCVICLLREIAGDILYSPDGKNLDEKTKKLFKDLKYKCDAKQRYFFNCIDRDNPFISDGVIGYKVIEVPKEAMDAIASLSSKLSAVDITSVENGIDIVISKGGGTDKKVKYTVQPVYDGMTIKKSPLTEAEKEMKLLDLKIMCGKKQDQEVLTSKLESDWKELIETSSSTKTASTGSEKSPQDSGDDIPF